MRSYVYFAGSLRDVAEIRNQATALEELGYKVVSRWHDQRESPIYYRRMVIIELSALPTADVVVVPGEIDVWGALILGKALNTHQRIVRVGETHPYGMLPAVLNFPSIHKFDTWQAAYQGFFMNHANRFAHGTQKVDPNS